MTSQQESASAHQDIPTVVRHWADFQPDKEVFVFFSDAGRTTSLTARDVYYLAGRFASRLRALGFQEGDLINNAIPNSAERVVTDFGIMMAGCIGSNCQIMEKDGSDFWKTANNYKMAGVILPNHKENASYTVLQKFLPSNLPTSRCVEVSIPEVPSWKHIILIDRHSQQNESFLDSLRQGSDEIFVADMYSPDSTVYVFSTSGTTGFSKLSPRTHRQILGTARLFEKGPATTRISSRPLGWVGGFPFSYLANCTCIVIQDCFEGKANLSVQKYWDIVESEGCTSGFMLPQEMAPFLRHFKGNPPKYRLKAVITGGQPLTKGVCDALGVITDALIVSYASTEMGGVTNYLITRPEQMEDFKCGKPLPGVELKVIDENLQEVDAGMQGVVLVKSPVGANHYYNQTFPKPSATEDGFFITGDRGWLDQDGVLYVSDRNDDVTFLGATLVYPSWPESVLYKIPGVSEAVVFGLGDNNNKLCACVILQPDSQLTKERLIKSYDEQFSVGFFPKFAHVEIFSSFPKGHTGKVNKLKLREMVEEMLL